MSTMSEYVLKIGGSVLTDKASEETLSNRFEEIISYVDKEGVIVHGAGSFGHPHAERHDLTSGSRTGVYETHKAVKDLNTRVVEKLRQNNVDAFPLHPSSMAIRNQETRINLEPLFKIKEEGFTPVIHGDGIVHTGQGFSILSGDEIATEIRRKMDDGRLGFCTSVPGVLDSEGEVVEEIDSMKDFADQDVEGVDVTGGMKNKLEKIFDKQVDARIFGVEDLEGFMNGEEVGTLVRGSSP